MFDNLLEILKFNGDLNDVRDDSHIGDPHYIKVDWSKAYPEVNKNQNYIFRSNGKTKTDLTKFIVNSEISDEDKQRFLKMLWE